MGVALICFKFYGHMSFQHPLNLFRDSWVPVCVANKNDEFYNPDYYIFIKLLMDQINNRSCDSLEYCYFQARNSLFLSLEILLF